MPHAAQNVSNWTQLENVSADPVKGQGCPGAAHVGTACFPGKASHCGMINKDNVAKEITLGKNGFSLLQQLPQTEAASGGEAGSQRKVNSETNELGKGNGEVEGKKTPNRNYLSNLPRLERRRKSQL